MSRIGRMPIGVPDKVTMNDGRRGRPREGPQRGVVTGDPRGDQRRAAGRPTGRGRASEIKQHKALHGLTRSLVNNMVVGVTTGFTKTLDITGVGYRATMAGQRLTLALGYSHPVDVMPPTGVSFAVEGANRIVVSGIDKQQVGETAAQIRRLRKPEPYKGKGIRYSDEVVRRKAGKAGKVGGKKK